MAAVLVHLLKNLPLLILAPFLSLIAWFSLLACSACRKLFRPPRVEPATTPDRTAASVVIPNWNGRELLEKYLPSVIHAMGSNPRNEIIVVDNGSTDGSADFVRATFPQVRLIALDRNLGFGGGSNLGFQEARNDIAVLLNSDMRVAPDFLAPLLECFTDSDVFAVSCQIFFTDPEKKRQETGLTEGWWENGALRVRHVDDPAVNAPYPVFYPGGGSSAFDRRKFLELGGFDRMFHPFYYEDTDLGYQAWKRGWKVLYQPQSAVWHEHRATIGRRFSQLYVDAILRRNRLLFAWKNIHSLSLLTSHFFYTWAGASLSAFAGDSHERPSLAGLFRAFLQLPGVLASRWRALSLAVTDDREAFRRSQGGYFRDRFERLTPNPERLNVLFVSPYPVCPAVHGGGVFMRQTILQLGRLSNLHLITLVDQPSEIAAHDELRGAAASMEFLVRLEGQPKGIGAITPFAVREFASRELNWLIHRQIYLKKIDVVQLEYTNMGQYAGPYRQIAWTLFEHDVYFQSISRGLSSMSLIGRTKGFVEYLRALRWELRTLPALDQIQACTEENRRYLLSFLPDLEERIDSGLRAGIDTTAYEFRPFGRAPKTMLFLGSFRHLPNHVALRWFLDGVMPRVLEQEPEARLLVIGSDPPPAHTIPSFNGSVELVGFVEDVRKPLADYSVFVCPILTGSGVRVKLLEAFAAGIPTVSTRIGAEGLASDDGAVCALADTPAEFASRIVDLLRNPDATAGMVRRARDFVVSRHDIGTMTRALEATYRRTLTWKLSRFLPPAS